MAHPPSVKSAYALLSYAPCRFLCCYCHGILVISQESLIFAQFSNRLARVHYILYIHYAKQ